MRSWRSSLVELGVLLVVAVILWRDVPAAPPFQDERYYLEAGSLIRQGRSPYESALYLYPPLTAEVFARLGTPEDPGRGLPLVRTLNILAAVLFAWLCVCRLERHWVVRAFGAACLLALAPLHESISYFGNLTPVSAAPCLAALILWPAAPVLAGLLLGLGLAVKPLLIGAAILLPVHRPESGGRRHLLCSAVAAATVGVLVFAQPHALDFLRQDQEVRGESGAMGSSSIQCALLFLDLHLPAAFVALVVLGAAVALARSRAMSPRTLLVLACVSSLLALPRVWIHTFCLALPLLAFSAENAARRWGDASSRPEKKRAFLGVLSFVLAALIINSSQAWSGSWGYPPGYPRAILAFGTLLAPAAALFLAFSALSRTERDDGAGRRLLAQMCWSWRTRARCRRNTGPGAAASPGPNGAL